MKNYLLIKDNVVENVIVWDGEAEYDHGSEYKLIEQTSDVGIGYIMSSNGEFLPPEPMPEPEFINYAVIKMSTNTVIDINKIEKTIDQFSDIFLDPSSKENVLIKCDNNVEPGWKFIDGKFVEPS